MSGSAGGTEPFRLSIGSAWHRWEPHIHAPGTILNNQFGAVDPWGAYLTSLEGLKQLQSETATELDAKLTAILDKAFKGELLRT